jgi:hypothetical protein
VTARLILDFTGVVCACGGNGAEGEILRLNWPVFVVAFQVQQAGFMIQHNQTDKPTEAGDLFLRPDLHRCASSPTVWVSASNRSSIVISPPVLSSSSLI